MTRGGANSVRYHELRQVYDNCINWDLFIHKFLRAGHVAAVLVIYILY